VRAAPLNLSVEATPFQRPRDLTIAAVAALVLCSLAPATASADALTPQSGGSANAGDIDSLYKLVLWVALAVFVGVEGMLVYSLVAFRARRGRVAAQIRGNTRLEIGWTIGAGLIVVVITLITFLKLGAIVNPPPAESSAVGAWPNAAAPALGQPPSDSRALRVKVIGRQYIWSFRYPDGLVVYEEMVVPTRTTIRLDIVSRDVVHSWWIPELGGKADAVPGYTNHSWFRIERAGVFRGQCAELCGRNHAEMIAHVRAVSPARFEAWLADQRRDIADAERARATADSSHRPR
jgi:cytochrome c oxidase subunit 2